ncbi:MAG: hypothetical protein HY719_17295, partial [Planctomycetes bacterium]|nr:hypothetical protein [Planctomycetota bacterium]
VSPSGVPAQAPTISGFESDDATFTWRRGVSGHAVAELRIPGAVRVESGGMRLAGADARFFPAEQGRLEIASVREAIFEAARSAAPAGAPGRPAAGGVSLLGLRGRRLRLLTDGSLTLVEARRGVQRLTARNVRIKGDPPAAGRGAPRDAGLVITAGTFVAEYRPAVRHLERMELGNDVRAHTLLPDGRRGHVARGERLLLTSERAPREGGGADFHSRLTLFGRPPMLEIAETETLRAAGAESTGGAAPPVRLLGHDVLWAREPIVAEWHERETPGAPDLLCAWEVRLRRDVQLRFIAEPATEAETAPPAGGRGRGAGRRGSPFARGQRQRFLSADEMVWFSAPAPSTGAASGDRYEMVARREGGLVEFAFDGVAGDAAEVRISRAPVGPAGGHAERVDVAGRTTLFFTQIDPHPLFGPGGRSGGGAGAAVRSEVNTDGPVSLKRRLGPPASGDGERGVSYLLESASPSKCAHAAVDRPEAPFGSGALPPFRMTLEPAVPPGGVKPCLRVTSWEPLGPGSVEHRAPNFTFRSGQPGVVRDDDPRRSDVAEGRGPVRLDLLLSKREPRTGK